MKPIFHNFSLAAIAAASLLSMSSCINDDIDPCFGDNEIQFRWDYNMLFADAFSENVGSVAVYGFDKNSGVLRWMFTEKGSVLKDSQYRMKLEDVRPGDYTIVAWCGLENEGTRAESFHVPEVIIGQSTIDDLNCRMEREQREDGTAHSATDLYDLYHGMTTDVTILPTNTPEGRIRHTFPIGLKKNTNSVRIILQQLSGADIDTDKFTFTVEDENGLLNYDNTLLPDEEIIYHPWQKYTGTAGLLNTEDEETTRAIRNNLYLPIPTRADEYNEVKVAIADITTSRLMANKRSVLTVKNNEGTTVARIPLTDYALLVKDKYGRQMTDQEYLDRQDHYTMTFFLDKNSEWISTSIIINSWRVVFQSQDLQ